ncbi:LysE/ArgO family amino acid transporter [Kordiimonas sp. SCSIO 12610]|uniref:LysE/ArgO family amino acid transporter n=1 Tax=Kordiimonas sp. SCSIO 12610 TaxID=2829597 RepID=UPI00210BBEAE|nr:LysE family transporter [Kordiimonas sp. SCSIO 12610]UTW54481.1 LysE family transporter [Kordiimonas sp. SCSIO 12610]
MSASIFFEAFIISLGLLTAIGPQNAYVLRQGLRHRHVFAVTTTTFLSDTIMICLGVLGVGITLQKFPLFSTILGWGGVLFLVWFALMSVRRALSPEVVDQNMMDEAAGNAAGQTVKVAILHALAFAWLNPWAYVDTMALLGGVSSKYPFGGGKISFLLGAVAASAIWFYGLAMGAKKMAPLFAKKVTWQILDSLIAIIMLAISITLAVHLLQG